MKTGEVVQLDKYRQRIGAKKGEGKRGNSSLKGFEGIFAGDAQHREDAMLSISSYVRGVLQERADLVTTLDVGGGQETPRAAGSRFKVLMGGKG